MFRTALFAVALVGCDVPAPDSSGRTVVAPRPPLPIPTPGRHVSGDRSGIELPTEGTTTPTLPGPDQACYLGANGAGTTCLDLVGLAPVPADYLYPAPLGGDVQYSAPVLYLDLLAIDPATQLAPNFRLDEFALPSKGQYAVVQPHAVSSVQGVRDELGPLVVNSGYRSPGYNAGIPGSATYSRHTYGDGFDLDPASVSLDTLAEACWDHGAGYVGVYVSHIHCDWRDDPVDALFFGLGVARWLSMEIAPAPIREASLVEADGVFSAPAEGWDEGEPLRRWWAWDLDGVLLAHEESETFEPPPGTAAVSVNIGLELDLDLDL